MLRDNLEVWNRADVVVDDATHYQLEGQALLFDRMLCASGLVNTAARKKAAQVIVRDLNWKWRGPAVHICSGMDCCPNGKSDCVGRLAAAIKTLATSQVGLPSLSRWTAMIPACAFLAMLLMIAGDIVVLAVCRAFPKVARKAKEEQPPASEDDAEDDWGTVSYTHLTLPTKRIV